MKKYINTPIKQSGWDPSKGDFFNEQAINEDKLYIKRRKRKKWLIALLALTHIVLISMIFVFY